MDLFVQSEADLYGFDTDESKYLIRILHPNHSSIPLKFNGKWGEVDEYVFEDADMGHKIGYKNRIERFLNCNKKDRPDLLARINAKIAQAKPITDSIARDILTNFMANSHLAQTYVVSSGGRFRPASVGKALNDLFDLGVDEDYFYRHRHVNDFIYETIILEALGMPELTDKAKSVIDRKGY